MPYLSWSDNNTIEELKFKDEIFKKLDKNNLLLISSVWYWLKQEEINKKAKEWLDASPNNKVITESLYDPYACKFTLNLDSKRIIRIGSRDILFWALYVDKFFKKYSKEELQLAKVDNLFLCYQRKPSLEREILYKKLNGLNGVITYGGNSWGKIKNDIKSLGEINTWNTSFLNIVSETVSSPEDDLFISEKTFKPIIGLRPFLIYGDTRITEYLESLGFRTFNKYFDYYPPKISNIEEFKVQANLILDCLKKIKDPIKAYKDLEKDIYYNYNHFYKVVQNSYKNIENLKEVL